jgi:hypothetical protein
MMVAVYEAKHFGQVVSLRGSGGGNDPFMDLAPISMERFRIHSEEDEFPHMLLLTVKRLRV